MDTIEELRAVERELLSRRENLKKEIRGLTKDLYNTRQKIKYVESNQKPRGSVFAMFGKKIAQLTPEERKEYNRRMQEKKRRKL
jgi:hypothetical protein